ncbi:unnamed protein product [Peniophora sp. CBMAI 1063]|nr:unnamed protein product [Peniophora sp. CBMAI 1063]
MPISLRIVVDFSDGEEDDQFPYDLSVYPFYNPALTTEERLRLLPDFRVSFTVPQWISHSVARRMLWKLIVYFLQRARSSIQGLEAHMGTDGRSFVRQFERLFALTIDFERFENASSGLIVQWCLKLHITSKGSSSRAYNRSISNAVTVGIITPTVSLSRSGASRRRPGASRALRSGSSIGSHTTSPPDYDQLSRMASYAGSSSINQSARSRPQLQITDGPSSGMSSHASLARRERSLPPLPLPEAESHPNIEDVPPAINDVQPSIDNAPPPEIIFGSEFTLVLTDDDPRSLQGTLSVQWDGEELAAASIQVLSGNEDVTEECFNFDFEEYCTDTRSIGSNVSVNSTEAVVDGGYPEVEA